jgi:anti-sigma regulatory factor (Ser/Thr protein kinase)
VALRQNVVRHALDAGFARSASEDLALGVTEVAINSVLHGGGGGLMRLWEEDATLICEVSDTGRIDQPLAGRERPQDGQIGGFGLWLANDTSAGIESARSARSSGRTPSRPGSSPSYSFSSRRPRGGGMYARVVRFTDVDPDHLAERLADVEASEGPPVDIPAKGVQILHDPDQRTAVVIQLFETADDVAAAERPLDAMDPAETPGTRSSIDRCEIKAELGPG